LYGAFVWARRALNRPKRRFPARAEGLENSHYVLGPAMCWLYIFLVYFVLMSVFIALIAESYEKARGQRSSAHN
jgi:hypothetical protein